MKNILMFGAGLSASYVIKYLLERAEKYDWFLTIAEKDKALAEAKINGHSRATVVEIDIYNNIERIEKIQKADIVISMLPAFMHPMVAEDCIALGKNMVTASYVSEEMKALDDQAKQHGVILLNEMGVDPGIDHMSAMQVIDKLKDNNYDILQFESFTGGLVAPESDNNPWNYKFTWNPRNVVLAGQGGAVKFVQEGRYKYIPYSKLFRRTEIIEVDGYGRFEGYANRDSLKYQDVYDLNIPTLYRGTLRRPGFCRAWDVFVQLGATADDYEIDCKGLTKRQFLNLFLAYNPHDSIELKLMHYLNIPHDSEIIDKLNYLGLFSDEPIELDRATPAQVLEYILKDKWKMEETDIDMIVMYHKFGFETPEGKRQIESSMVCKGEDNVYTAMAKTVGLPVAIGVKLILEGKINQSGVHRPIKRDIYEPVLEELKNYGIEFTEKESEYVGY